MIGVALFSFFVWQHHLFVSGIDADLRPFYMLSTEIISLPTGFTFLCVLGTLWRGRIRFTVPMLFCLAWVFNFLFGGISGVFLSDVPSDVTTHGSRSSRWLTSTTRSWVGWSSPSSRRSTTGSRR